MCVAGQFYTLYFKGNSSLQLPSLVKTVLALTFFEEPDKRVEHSRWQYWYNMQPNPNQKAFDIGVCVCGVCVCVCVCVWGVCVWCVCVCVCVSVCE